MPSNIFTNDSRLQNPMTREHGSPFATMARTMFPTTLEEVFNWCTPAGTLVDLDKYGITAPIESLKEGDTVLSADGCKYPIERVGSREVDEELISIKMSGSFGNNLRITGDHPILAWRPKSNRKPSELNFDKAEAEKQYIPTGELKEGDWVCHTRPVYEATCKEFPYSPFIVGLYIAEGCLVKRCLSDGRMHAREVQFTLGSHETELIKALTDELRDYCGAEAKVYTPNGRPDIVQVRIFDPELSTWLQDNIGELSHHKHLSECIFHLPIELRIKLLAAWIDGDGHVFSYARRKCKADSVDAAISLSSASFDLLYQAMLLAQSCGLNPSLLKCAHNNKSEKRFIDSTVQTVLNFNMKDVAVLKPHVLKAKGLAPEGEGRGNKVYFTDNFVWHKVEALTRESFKGLVYSIKVTTSHNYICNGIVTHNCEYLSIHHGTYSKAIQRAVRYFLTKVEIAGTTDFKVKRKYKDYLEKTLGILDQLAIIGDDFKFYGNSFTSVYKPFYRNLACPKCSCVKPIAQVEYDFGGFKFKGRCWKCQQKVIFKVQDIPYKTDELRIIRWNPRTIEIEFHPTSNEYRYYFEAHAKYKSALANGDKIFVENTPMEIINAIANDQKFLFNKGEIYHMKNAVPASFIEDSAGWGMPPFLANFEQVIHLQMLTKYNEAMVMDYLMPFRCISPGAGKSSDVHDPLLTLDTGRFMSKVTGMIKEHRKDPTTWHTIPYPIQYQALGGEARDMAPVELLQQALDNLLSSMGIPQEMYKESLGAGGPPIGLRMFERSETHFISELNKYLDWIMNQCSKHLMWEECSAHLVRTSVLEDDMVRQVKMNLLAANKVSNQTALSAFNIDYEYEVDKILEEQQMFDEKMREMQRLSQKAQQTQDMFDQGPQQAPAPGAGGMQGTPPSPAGAAPGAGPSPGGGSMEELDAQAEQLAQQFLTMEPSARKSQLITLGKTQKTLHDMVVGKLKTLEGQAKQTGLNATRAGQLPPPGQPQQ